MILSEKLGKYFNYESIREMPLAVWLQVHDTGQLPLIIKRQAWLYRLLVRLRVVSVYQLKASWNLCYTEYVQEFGLSPAYSEYLDKTRMLIYALIDYALDTSSINHTYLKIAESELQMFFDTQERANFGQIHAVVERWKGFRMPVETTTVYEFYSSYKAMEAELKAKEKTA